MNVNVFGIPNFETWFLSRKSDKTLPGSVKDKLSGEEEKRLLEIIEEFEKSPTDIEAKKKKYTELMKLFYKGIGLQENGAGTISPENERAALELSGLINDAILQDQQNISGKYNTDQLNKALKLQDKFREDLELRSPDFKRLLTADTGTNNELSAGKNDYQTEKITSYLAKNKEDFTKIFKELSKARPDLKKLTKAQKEKLKNLKTLAGRGNQNILSRILSTFKEFKDYRFTNADLTKMKKSDGTTLQVQANTESTHDNWERLTTISEEGGSPTGTSTRSADTNNRPRDSSKTDRVLEKILASFNKSLERLERLERLEKLEERDTERYTKRDTDVEKNTEKQASTPWLDIFRTIGYIASNVITGLGNNNQNYCCYPPAPCSGRGTAYCPPVSYPQGGSGHYPPRPYYVGGDTWPWGRANGINSEYSAFNNYMPSSGSYSATSNPSSTSSSNPYSSSSAYNPITISVNPVFNNNPIQSSASYSGSGSSNAAEIRRHFGIS